ncbi:hypothetical protein LINPERPRIM_LOCUS20023 [Linum perenne]
MTCFAAPDCEGSLPFGALISSLVARLGIPLCQPYFEETSVEHLHAQHVLRRVGWSKCVHLPVNVSGGEIRYNCSGLDADVVNSAKSLFGVIMTNLEQFAIKKKKSHSQA